MAGQDSDNGSGGAGNKHTPVTVYNAVSDRLPRPQSSVPPRLGPAGSVFIDADFGTRLIRVTDPNIIPDFPKSSYFSMPNGQNVEWNADSTRFVVTDPGGNSILYTFDPAAFAVSLMKDPDRPDANYFQANYFVQWSYTDPDVYYGSGPSGHTASAYNLATGESTLLVDWDTLIPTGGLPSPYYGGLGSTDQSGTILLAAIGGIQNTFPYLVVYNTNSQESAVLDLKNSRVRAFGSDEFTPAGFTLGFGIHAAFLDRTGRYVMFGGSSGGILNPNNYNPDFTNTFVWDLQTNAITEIVNNYGHSAFGFGASVNLGHTVDGNGYDTSWFVRSLGDPNNPTELGLPEVSAPRRSEQDGHPSWNNAAAGVNAPFVQEVFVNPSNNYWFPQRAYDNEIIAVATDGSNAIWRFAHTYDGIYGSFFDQPRANVSQNGRYALFTSNWFKTLGNDASGAYRYDVFLVDLDQKYPAKPVADQTAPSKPVFLHFDPANPSINVSGTADFTAAAADNVGVAGIIYRTDTFLHNPPSTQPPFSNVVDTTKLSDGQHAMIAIAYDAQGNTSQSDLLVYYVNNGNPAPPPAPTPTPAPPPAPTPAAALNSISSIPNVLASGQSGAGLVALTAPAPAGGAVISLSSSYPAGASVPATVTVAQGAIAAGFSITAGTVASSVSVTLTASYLGVSKSGVLTVNPPSNLRTSKASFLGADAGTEGNWSLKYGAEGYALPGAASQNPAYVTPSSTGPAFVWSSSTTDARALQKPNAGDRIAAAWYSDTSFTVDLNFADQATHQVAIYCMDWDNYGPRTQTIDVLDANGNVLDTRSLAGFYFGQYLVWNVSGHVKIRAAAVRGNAVIEGLFFGGALSAPAPAPGAAATYLFTDTATQGNWKSRYGLDGYALVGDGTVNPLYVIPASSGFGYVWSASTSDGRALQKANASDRIAAAWYSDSAFIIDLNFTDQSAHQVAIYCIDWDNYGPRAQTIDILDASNRLLDTRRIAGFYGGQYLVWNLAGHVRIRATASSGNAVIEGIFFGGVGALAPQGATAKFLGADTSTQGNWRSKYGSEGYTVVGDAAVNPPYAAPASSGGRFVWNSSTGDGRALQKANASDRVAAAWYSDSNFTIDLNFADLAAHQVAIYCLDWDNYGPRVQKVEILDGSNNVLDTRVLSGFHGGQYLVWNLSGRVKIRATTLTGNSVVEGLFFH